MSHFNMWIWYFTIFPISTYYPPYWGFPDSSFGKESTCKAGDPGTIPGLGRSPGEGTGYSIQYSWASLVAQMVKNLPAMWETWVRSLSWEDPLEEGTQPTLVFLPWEFLWTEEPGRLQSMEAQRVGYDWVTKHRHHSTPQTTLLFILFLQDNVQRWSLM